MRVIDELIEIEQYSLSTSDKRNILLSELNNLTERHHDGCSYYRNIIDSLYSGKCRFESLTEVPYLPVKLFKTTDLKSVSDSEVVKTLTSSGTSSQQVSKIYLDKWASIYQTRVLASIIGSFIGNDRLPMIFIDSDSIINNKEEFSARGAGLTGLSIFGRDHFYALNKEMEIDVDGLAKYVRKYQDRTILIFGFTFLVWEYLYQALKVRKESIDLGNSVLIHGGGWKKLQERAVSARVFKEELRDFLGIKRIHDFYGMVEQIGSIFMECEEGYFHAPNFSDILIRDFENWETLPMNQSGVIQTLSILPHSYPGHSLLTEDIGTIRGIDDCPCGRMGPYFTVEGRIPRSELRGCSDTHTDQIRSELN